MKWFDHTRLSLMGLDILVKRLASFACAYCYGIITLIISPVMWLFACTYRINDNLITRLVMIVNRWCLKCGLLIACICNRTPHALMKQLLIELIAIVIITFKLQKSVITLMIAITMMGIHTIFHKLVKNHSTQFIHFVSLITLLINCVDYAESVGNPNLERFEDILPGVKKWNGKAFYDFRIIWWPSLIAALSTVAQDGWTLVQVASSSQRTGPRCTRHGRHSSTTDSIY